MSYTREELEAAGATEPEGPMTAAERDALVEKRTRQLDTKPGPLTDAGLVAIRRDYRTEHVPALATETRRDVARLVATIEARDAKIAKLDLDLTEARNRVGLLRARYQTDKCKCTMAQALVGDGCQWCDPQSSIEAIAEDRDELRAEVERLRGASEAVAVEGDCRCDSGNGHPCVYCNLRSALEGDEGRERQEGE